MKFTNERSDGFGKFPDVVNERTVFQCLSFLSQHELVGQFHIRELTTTKISTLSHVLYSADITTFEGSEIEMKPMFAVTAIAILLKTNMRFSSEIYETVKEFYNSLSEKQQKAIMFQRDNNRGTNRLRILLALSQVDYHNELFYSAQIRFEDMLAAVLLVNETNCKLEEALEWAVPLQYNFAGQPIGFPKKGV